jgi:hypothetical protein
VEGFINGVILFAKSVKSLAEEDDGDILDTNMFRDQEEEKEFEKFFTESPPKKRKEREKKVVGRKVIFL